MSVQYVGGSAASSKELVLETFAVCRSEPSKRGELPPQPWRGRAFAHMDCGEDSFFVGSRFLGVADGVGGYRSMKINSGVVSNALMANARRFAVKRGVSDPKTLMQMAYDKMLQDGVAERGGTTACIASVTPEGKMNVANLGDSGVMVIREGHCVFRNNLADQEHEFNCPLQLSVPMKRTTPQDSTVEQCQLQHGDLVVMGSDGLFDNLFPEAIAQTATLVTQDSDAHNTSKIRLHPTDQSARETALHLEKIAFEASQNRASDTPFAQEAQAIFGKNSWSGGKKDDITVLVARVRYRKELEHAQRWSLIEGLFSQASRLKPPMPALSFSSAWMLPDFRSLVSNASLPFSKKDMF